MVPSSARLFVYPSHWLHKISRIQGGHDALRNPFPCANDLTAKAVFGVLKIPPEKASEIESSVSSYSLFI
jgi:hypothetical protein